MLLCTDCLNFTCAVIQTTRWGSLYHRIPSINKFARPTSISTCLLDPCVYGAEISQMLLQTHRADARHCYCETETSDVWTKPLERFEDVFFFRQKSNKCLIQISLGILFPPIILHSTPNHPTNKQNSFGYKWQISLFIPWDRQMFPVHPMLSHWTHTHTHTHAK